MVFVGHTCPWYVLSTLDLDDNENVFLEAASGRVVDGRGIGASSGRRGSGAAASPPAELRVSVAV